MTSVSVKWGGQRLDVEADTNEPPLVFKAVLFGLTGVAPERMKGKTLGDESWDGIDLKAGQQIMMMGSSAPILQAPTQDKGSSGTGEGSGEQKKPAKRPPRGLVNLGNTCYANSVVQALHSNPVLTAAVKSFTASEGVDAALVRALRSTYEMVDDPHQDVDKPVLPLLFIDALHRRFPQFSERTPDGRTYQQQDANECFTQLLLVLLQQLKAPQGQQGEKSVAPIKYCEGTYEVTLKCLEEGSDEVKKGTETFSQLSCYLDTEVRQLMTGLKSKMTEEIVMRSAVLAKDDAKFEKKLLISRLPAYMSVQMVRFFFKAQQAVGAKVLKDVKFPLVLDLYDLCTPQLQSKLRARRDLFKEMEDDDVAKMRESKLQGHERGTDGREENRDPDPSELLPYDFDDDPGSNASGFYQLQAVITHKGRSSASGHYVAWVRLEGRRWVMCDDGNISDVDEEDVLKLSGGGDWHTSYVLLYGPRPLRKVEKKAEGEKKEDGGKMETA